MTPQDGIAGNLNFNNNVKCTRIWSEGCAVFHAVQALACGPRVHHHASATMNYLIIYIVYNKLYFNMLCIFYF